MQPKQPDQNAFAFVGGRNGDALTQGAHATGHFGSKGSKGRLSQGGDGSVNKNESSGHKGGPSSHNGGGVSHQRNSGSAVDGELRKDGGPASGQNNSRPNSNLIDANAAPAGDHVGAEDAGTAKATSQVKQSPRLGGSGDGSQNSKNSKTSAPSVNDIHIMKDEQNNLAQ